MEDAWQAFWFTVILLIGSLLGLNFSRRGSFYRRSERSDFRWKFWQPRPGEDKKKFYTALFLQLLALVFVGMLVFIYVRYLKGISEL